MRTPTLQVWCDNEQTVGLVIKDLITLQTKLRHIDLHNHWLRQAVSRKDIRVEHISTSSMLANGLTKALGTDQFRVFRDLVGLIDITTLLEGRQGKVISESDLQELQDLVEKLDLDAQGRC